MTQGAPLRLLRTHRRVAYTLRRTSRTALSRTGVAPAWGFASELDWLLALEEVARDGGRNLYADPLIPASPRATGTDVRASLN